MRDTTYSEIEDTDKKIVEKENVLKAYFYGKQLVPVAKINEEILQFKDDKCLKMLGFTEESKVPRQHYMEGCDIVAPIDSAKNGTAFSALIHGMIETKKVMIAKFNMRGTKPKLVVLHPHADEKTECLYMNTLPTSEEIGDYQFGSLVPCTKEQEDVMDQFVDALNLDETELAQPESTFNPAIQHFNQTVIHRLGNGDEAPVPDINPDLLQGINPDPQVIEQAEQAAKEFDENFKLEEVPEDQLRGGRVYLRDIIL